MATLFVFKAIQHYRNDIFLVTALHSTDTIDVFVADYNGNFQRIFGFYRQVVAGLEVCSHVIVATCNCFSKRVMILFFWSVQNS